MKIAIPILSFTKSGGARVLAELANAWVAQGASVDFLVVQADSKPTFPTVANIVRGPCVSSQSVFAQLFALRRMISTAAWEGTDVILANYHLTAWALWAAGLRARSRAWYYAQAYEAEFYADHPSDFRGMVLSSLAHWSYRLLPRVVVNAPIYMDYPDMHAIDWVPPGVDCAKFYPRDIALRDLRSSNAGPVVLGCIGRPETWKGTSDCFAAVKLLRDRGVNFKLFSAFFAPSGHEDLADYVEVLRPGNDFELAAFYRSCDILLAPGTIQLGAAHYPVMEAMACNVPVITTGYLPASTDNALIVPVGRPDAIADAVMNVLSDPHAARRRAAAAVQAMAAFGWPAVAAKFLRLLQTPLEPA